MTTVVFPVFKDKPDLSTPVDADGMNALGVAANAAIAAAEAAAVAATAPTDTIMAAKVADAASLTRAAANAVYASKRGGVLEVNEDFSTYPDGALVTTSNGQPWLLSTGGGSAGSNATDRTPRVVGGKMTYADTADIGGYATVVMDGPLRRIGAAFTFSPYIASGGLASFAVMTGQVATGLGLYRAPIHFVISPEGWGIDVIQTDGTSVVNITVGTFTTPLVADDTTVHEASVVLDRDEGYAYIYLPDGSLVKSPQSDYFKVGATFAFWEPFKTVGSVSAKTLAKFVRVWADSRATDADLTSRALVRATGPGPMVALALVGALTPQTGVPPYHYRDNAHTCLTGAISVGADTPSVVVFTLPVGARPSSHTEVPIIRQNAGTFSTVALEIRTDGNVICWAVAANDSLYLSGIRFLTA